MRWARRRSVGAVRRQVAADETGIATNQGDAEVGEDGTDRLTLGVQRAVQLRLQVLVARAHRDRQVVLERYGVFHEVDRLQGDRCVLHHLVVAGERSPHGGDIELAVDHLLHLVGRLILRHQVRVVAEVVDRDVAYVMVGERLADRRGLVDADLEPLQARVVEVPDGDAAIAAGGEHEGRAIQGRGDQYTLAVHRHVEHHVALLGVQGRARHAPLDAGPVVVLHPRAKVAGEHLGDLVLDALAAVVGKRHVARVRAHAQGAGAPRNCRARREYRQRGRRQHRRPFPHHRLPPRCRAAA